jgi:Tfp pilus assembly protein PilO
VKSRVYHMTAATVGLAALWYAFLYLPAERGHRDLEQQLSQVRAQMADFNATVAQLPSYMKAQTDVQAKLEAMNSHLYAKTDVLRLLDRLKADAAAYRLRVVEVTPPVAELLELSRSVATSDEPQFLNVSIRLTGNYQAFGEYCRNLEQAPFFRGVTACHIGTPPDEGPLEYGLTFRALLGTIRGSA